MIKNYYLILNIEPDATQKEVKSAYREKAKRFHPDAQNKGQEQFLDVQEAYETLSDPARRRSYDAKLARERRAARRRRPSQPPVEPLIPDAPWPHDRGRFDRRPLGALDDFFDRLGGSSGRRSHLQVALTPDQARRGGQVRLSLPMPVDCSACGGWGSVGLAQCRRCHGSGIVEQAYPIVIPFPPNVSPGDRMRVPLDRLGLPGVDLILQFRVN